MKYKDFRETLDYKLAAEIDFYSEAGEEMSELYGLPDEQLDEMEVVKFHRRGGVLCVYFKIK